MNIPVIARLGLKTDTLLEAQLNATCSAYTPFLKDKSPESNFMRALNAFQQAGLEEVTAKTFVRDIQAPLSDSERTALLSLFEMLWVEPQPDMSAKDWAEYKRLCTPESPSFIFNIPEYYAFFTYLIFHGKVRKEE